jgi:nitroreductase
MHMDAIENILTRRSVRHFGSTPVPDEEMDILLRAAMHAPSAGNAQPWHFVVVTDRAILNAVPKFHTSAEFIIEVPAAILVCADENVARPGRWLLDCSAAAQNILLAAHARGLGACWIGIQPDPVRIEGAMRLFNLPANVHPLCLIAVGYPTDTPPNVDRYLPERIHVNRW